MQQRTDRSGSHHRPRKPGVKRHQSGLGKAVQEHHQQHGEHRRTCFLKYTAARKVQRAGLLVHDDHRRQGQTYRGGEQVNEILAAALDRLVILIVGDERISGERQDLVKDKQRQQVRRKGDTDCRGNRDGEAGIKPGLRPVVIGAEQPNRIDRHRNPQRHRDQREQESCGIDVEGKANTRK